MLWTKAVLGTDVYHIIQWFLIYSILGWVVESIYMSICNRKLTNRGFVRGPICPIYGVGALTVYFLLRPVDHNLYLLYLMGCIIPTLLEYGTALLMLKIFGEVWWDYSQKPFNYKGILCLESTVAWGFLYAGTVSFPSQRSGTGSGELFLSDRNKTGWNSAADFCCGFCLCTVPEEKRLYSRFFPGV